MDLEKLLQRSMDQDNGAFNISDDGLQMMKEQMQNFMVEELTRLVLNCLTISVSIFLLYALHWLFFVPLNRVRKLEDVGWRHLPAGRMRAEQVNRARRLRKVGKPPPPFPNGWFVLCESRDLPVGKVLSVDALGLNFAVFRGESGQVFVTSAYCPHLGANLGVGGRVSGDCIRCPFHDWKFEGNTGTCVEVPYDQTSKIPGKARVETFTCLERNHLVMVWHHAEHEEPSWKPPLISEIESGQWTYRGRNENLVNCHIQDICENGGDMAHFTAVHEASIFSGSEPSQALEEATVGIASHEWKGSWKKGEEDHLAEVHLKHVKKLFGINVLSMDVMAQQIGPSLVNLTFDTVLGRGVMLQYVLPVEPNVQKLVHVFYTQPSFIAPYAKLVQWAEAVLVERDIRVWNSKRYENSPLWMAEDKLLVKHRRWYRQFYSPDDVYEADLSF